jgi:putative ABC transport system substrate-binding protein
LTLVQQQRNLDRWPIFSTSGPFAARVILEGEMTFREFTLHRSWTWQATIGFLGATKPSVWSEFVNAFDDRLRQLGWVDGSNVEIVYGWAEGRPDRYAKIAKDFVRKGVDLIVTSGTPAVLAAMSATKSIPIVFASAGDPVGAKLVKSLKKPGGNVTGQSNSQIDLTEKRLTTMRQAIPNLQRIAVMANTRNRIHRPEMRKIERLARRFGIKQVVPCEIERASQIGPAIKKLRGKVDGIYVCTDPLMTTHHVAINTAAANARLPTMHAFREYVAEAGGLMSYGPDFRAMFGEAADTVDKILHGRPPGEIPIKVHSKCDLVINRSTAHALGLRIPKAVRRRATMID